MADVRPDRLVVVYDGVAVAELYDRDYGVDVVYRSEAFDRWSLGVPVLSCSLPLRSGRVDATAFFDGLLPERPHRSELATRAGVVATDTYGLLARFGREIAGALVIVDDDTDPQRDAGVVELDAAALAEEVAALPERPLGIHDDSELSLAGVQDKMLLVAAGPGRWARPTGATPSTHILKLDHRRFRGLVAAEADAMALARAVGLTSVAAELVEVDGMACLIVERFDRVRDAQGEVVRVHQEDMCQATGRPPSKKYESRRGGGGPSFADVADVLDNWAVDPLDELDRLASVAAFTSLIGNADAHGKNLSVVHDTGQGVTLAPLYDQVPTALWPTLTTDAAMSVGGVVTLARVGTDAIAREARSWRHDPDRAVAAAEQTAASIAGVLNDAVIDPDGAVGTLVAENLKRFRTSSA